MLMEQVFMFHDIARERSISKAAKLGHMSQPALSQQIKRLEEELGVRLFERSNKGITMTGAGEVMEKYSEQFIKSYKGLREELEELKSYSGVFRVAATPIACDYALPCCLYKMNTRFPNYSVIMNSATSSEVVHRVKNEEADLGFIVGETSEEELKCDKVYSDDICLVAAKSFRIADKITLGDLKQVQMIILSEDYSAQRMLSKYLSRKGYPLDKFRVLFQLASTESVKSTVIAGHGTAFLPYITIKKEVYQGLVKIINVEDFELDYEVFSVNRKHKEDQAPEMNEILHYFKEIVTNSIC